MFRKIALLGLMLFSSTAAHATCTDPAGDEGGIFYNQTFKVMQFCNGTHWISMASGFSDTPAGAVMAFDLASCPAGWSEYTEARGRFLRGLCLDGTGCQDPDGVRAAGSTQADELKSHRHAPAGVGATAFLQFGAADANLAPTSAGSTFGGVSGAYTNYTGGDETRPKNVAVLYCRKD